MRAFSHRDTSVQSMNHSTAITAYTGRLSPHHRLQIPRRVLGRVVRGDGVDSGGGVVAASGILSVAPGVWIASPMGQTEGNLYGGQLGNATIGIPRQRVTSYDPLF